MAFNLEIEAAIRVKIQSSIAMMKRVKTIAIVIILTFTSYLAVAQDSPILLWPNGAPGSEGKTGEETVRVSQSGDHIVSNVHRPSLTPYLPNKDKATGAAIVVIPGGGHRELWMDHEGYRVATWLSDHGVAAFIVKYRLARVSGSTYTIEGTELADVKRAIRLVRSRAKEWSIDPQRVGVIGFSAGGELAALASSRPDSTASDSPDVIERESSRPSFQALLYPAIPRDINLSKETPPAFLACGENDRVVSADGLANLYLALKHAGVSAELHIFANAEHGFGIQDSNPPPVSDWPQLLLEWLGTQGMLKSK
jgi:acetyl esterase/lipase